MNGVIANVLNRVLGNFIEDLSSDSLNISLLSGEVTLEDLRIKSKVVDQIGLPYKLKSGYIGKI
jgi:hypothetical protein